MGTPQPAPDRENLAGLVERVTFHNEDSGFCVLRVKARGQRELITVVGHAAAIGAGEFVRRIRLQECAVDLLRSGGENAMQIDRVRRGAILS